MIDILSNFYFFDSFLLRSIILLFSFVFFLVLFYFFDIFYILYFFCIFSVLCVFVLCLIKDNSWRNTWSLGKKGLLRCREVRLIFKVNICSLEGNVVNYWTNKPNSRAVHFFKMWIRSVVVPVWLLQCSNLQTPFLWSPVGYWLKIVFCKIMFVLGMVTRLPILGCPCVIFIKRIIPADHCHFRVTKRCKVYILLMYHATHLVRRSSPILWSMVLVMSQLYLRNKSKTHLMLVTLKLHCYLRVTV